SSTMSKFFKLFGVAALVGMSAPAKATAMEVFNWSGCGGQNFASCATVIANYDDVTNVLSFSVQNTNATVGWPGRFTAVGFAGMGTPTGLSAPLGWGFSADDTALSGPSGLTFWSYSDTSGDGITPMNTFNFSVHFASGATFSNITFGLREQGLDSWDFGATCAGSNRLHVNKTGATYTETLTREGEAECYFPDDTPTDVVPEPATMVLLATGLIGLAGAQLRRRKNTKV
ncbi:MAG TPA: PEP-CTERM sorting domain-containing protein, partial [Gemmatimonadales bacterium]|nr:PEP-CTERM sorting domain-containing protein [Gemmatimonadales bacterium]